MGHASSQPSEAKAFPYFSPASSVCAVPAPNRSRRRSWQRSYARRLAAVDAVVLGLSMLVALGARFGVRPTAQTNGGISVSYGILGLLLVVVWMILLQLFGTRDERIVGDGTFEYRRVVNATMMVFGGLAMLSVLFKIDMSRGYLAIAFPLGLVSVLAGRKVGRIWLRAQRMHGKATTRVLVVGGHRSAHDLITHLARSTTSGMEPVATWVPDRAVSAKVQTALLPAYGADRPIEDVVAETDVDMVILAETRHLGHHGLRDLVWRLGALDVDLMVSPNIVDVSDGRLQLTTVAAMPFLHIDEPQYAAAAAWPKVIFDRVLATALVVLLAPVLVAVAVAVRASGPGPVLYRQERIGRDGSSFWMIKFRSMRCGADAELGSLLEADGQSAGPLYKLEHDPRVTPVGRFIRRFSIDELPQLFNVLKGDMSLVGPRPQRDFEVEAYDEVAHRRLRVRPGMTGLWQVSGRSNLSWEDAVRLDTYYVENWSMTADIVLLWRTVRTIFRHEGAY